MSILDKSSTTQLQTGLNKEMTYQKPGDLTFALNALRDSHTGGKFEYQSEPGNEQVESLPDGYTFMGSINGINNEIYIFASDGASSGTIGIFKEGKYTEIVEGNFGWNPAYPITGEFRMKNGCERMIYWGNNDAPDGHFNFDAIDEYKTGGVYDVNKFKFIPEITCPKINLVKVNSAGGILPLGSYYFQLEIIDKNENVIYRTDISPQTIIYNEDQSDAYNNIDGGLNAPQYDPAIGGVPITNKSITLEFSNLDTTFNYLRVNVIRQIAGNQTIDAHAVGQLIAITDDTIRWTYTGYNVNNGDFPLDYSSLIIDDIKYASSYVQEQVQGRFLRANVKQDNIDYTTFQSFASLITAEWVAKEIETANQNDVGNPKNPNTYWECTSFQGDEIYAFGIQYLLKNGDWSPVFHIPGRQATVTDLEQLTVVSNGSVLGPLDVWLSDVEHIDESYFDAFIPGVIGSTIARWKVFNTATITTSNTVTHPYDYIGDFGYYETEETYPDIRDCDNNFIWGEDSLGDPLNDGVNIRHFRFPDRRLVPHIAGTNGEYLVPLGVKFDNITYPSGDIVGHRFCHSIRNDNTKTVVDSGWAVQPLGSTSTAFGDLIYLNANFFDYTSAATDDYARFNSANIAFNKKIFNPDYLKLNTAYHIESFPDSEEVIETKTGGTDTITSYTYLFLVTDSATPERTNHNIENQVFVPAGTTTSPSIFGISIQSDDHLTDDNILRLTYPLENSSSILPAQVQGGANITDPVTGTLEYNNFYCYKKTNLLPYGDILNLQYKYLNFNFAEILDSNEYYNGDSLISLNAQTRMFWPVINGISGDNILQGLCYTTFYEEHDFNPVLRHGGTGDTFKYHRAGENIYVLLEKVAEKDADTTYTWRPEVFQEYYAYNTDYTLQYLEKPQISLPPFYEYCSDCRVEFPNRIIWGPKSFDEENFDLYRINKVNDYIDIPAHRGPITGLAYRNNQLIVHTQDSTFILQPDPQRISTDQNTAYLTTGDFLSVPPQEILQTDIGYAGMQSKQSMCNTPYGHAWCDQKRGQVFNINTSLEEIATIQNGMSQWFKEELPSYMDKDFYAEYEYDYPNRSTYDGLHNGIGVIMFYDPRYKRLFISKKDYKPINLDSTSPDVGDIYYDSATNEWKYRASTLVTVTTNFGNTNLFENKSWNISYSFDTGTWISWHTYKPWAAFSDNNYYYTFNNTSTEVAYVVQNIWRHMHYNNYQKYYGTKYDFIVEYMVYDTSTDVLSTIHYQGYSYQWDDTNKQWIPVDATFNGMIAYTPDQSTGRVVLQLADQFTSPYANIGFSNTTKYVIKTDENYKISGLYDILTTDPPMSSDWTLTKAYGSYIDKVPITANHNFTSSAYSLGNLKNKFVLCRLFYKPAGDYKKVINLIQTTEMYSPR